MAPRAEEKYRRKMALAKTGAVRIIGALPATLFQGTQDVCGRSSVVEHLVANENVVSSNLIARSNIS